MDDSTSIFSHDNASSESLNETSQMSQGYIAAPSLEGRRGPARRYDMPPGRLIATLVAAIVLVVVVMMVLGVSFDYVVPVVLIMSMASVLYYVHYSKMRRAQRAEEARVLAGGAVIPEAATPTQPKKPNASFWIAVIFFAVILFAPKVMPGGGMVALGMAIIGLAILIWYVLIDPFLEGRKKRESQDRFKQ